MTKYQVTLTMPGGATYRIILDHPTGSVSLSDLAAEADSLWALGAGDTLSVEALAADSPTAELDEFIRQMIAGRDEDSDAELFALLRDTWPQGMGTEGGQIEVRDEQVHYRTTNAEEQEDITTWKRSPQQRPVGGAGGATRCGPTSCKLPGRMAS